MFWTVTLKISVTVLLLTAGLLTIPHALLGVILKNVLIVAAGVSGVVAALSAFKLKDADKTHAVSEKSRSNSHSENVVASKEHNDVHDGD